MCTTRTAFWKRPAPAASRARGPVTVAGKDAAGRRAEAAGRRQPDRGDTMCAMESPADGGTQS